MATKKTAQKTNGMDKADMVAAGAGIATLAAGLYFFFGPEGKKHQKKMRGWMVRMKGDVIEKLEETQDVTEPVYNSIVDTIAGAYAVAGKIPKNEILDLAADLKRQWKTIKRTVAGPKKVASKSAPKKAAPKKAAAKPASKSSARKAK